MNKQFKEFLDELFLITSNKKIKFAKASERIEEYINFVDKRTFLNIVKEIGMIPERIDASSSEEKLFSKASDYILARCFNELGMKAKAVNERGNSADIISESIHGYSLVADAKTFRLSRTAKNQKDFKVSTLSNWRGSEHEFALLVAPYFQYPIKESQIYSSSLDNKVCLLSWEHILFFLNNNIKETDNFSLENIWDAPVRLSRDKRIAYADRMNCQIPFINKIICERMSVSVEKFQTLLNECRSEIIERGVYEKTFLLSEARRIEKLTREEAIEELLTNRKFAERIQTIERFINKMNREV